MEFEQQTAVLSAPDIGSKTIEDTSIYIVDDQSEIGVTIAVILRREGFNVKWHIDPESALNYLSTEPESPILLLTDYMMDAMDGLELIARFKQARPNMKAILFSGYDCEAFLEDCTILPDGFITKPFDTVTLVSKIRSVLAQ